MLWHCEADVGHNYLLSIQLSNTWITGDMKMCLRLPTTSNYPVISSDTLMQTTLLLFINKFVLFLAVGGFLGIHWSCTFFWEALGSQKVQVGRLLYFKKSLIYFCKIVNSVIQKVLGNCKEAENKDIKWFIMEFVSNGK